MDGEDGEGRWKGPVAIVGAVVVAIGVTVWLAGATHAPPVPTAPSATPLEPPPLVPPRPPPVALAPSPPNAGTGAPRPSPPLPQLAPPPPLVASAIGSVAGGGPNAPYDAMAADQSPLPADAGAAAVAERLLRTQLQIEQLEAIAARSEKSGDRAEAAQARASLEQLHARVAEMEADLADAGVHDARP